MNAIEDRKLEAVKRYVRLHGVAGQQQKRLFEIQNSIRQSLRIIAKSKARRAAALSPVQPTPTPTVQLPTTPTPAPADPYADLTPRLRQTLDLLLQGDSEKQVAKKLHLSRHTIHLYVTALYRHFDVHSRAELLALCLTPPNIAAITPGP